MRLVGALDVCGGVVPEHVADVATETRRGRASHHGFDAGADVFDLEVAAHERDDVGRVLHEIAEVGTAFLDAHGGLFRRLRRRSERANDQGKQDHRRAGDRVRGRRLHDRRCDAALDRDLTAEDGDHAPREPGSPRLRAVHAHRVGDRDRVGDHEERSPAGRVHHPRGADRRDRGAELQPPGGREVALDRDDQGVGDAAREQQDDEEPQRRVRDEVRLLQPRDREDGRGPGREDEKGSPNQSPGAVDPSHRRGIGTCGRAT